MPVTLSCMLQLLHILNLLFASLVVAQKDIAGHVIIYLIIISFVLLFYRSEFYIQISDGPAPQFTTSD